MQDDPFRDRLKRLEERIEAARGPKPGTVRRRSNAAASGLGWRMVTELLAGMLIGLAIGYGLDSLFGTRPVFLVVFALFGFAAGVRTMMRSAEEVRRKQEAAQGRAAEPAAAGRKIEATAAGRPDATTAAGRPDATAAAGRPDATTAAAGQEPSPSDAGGRPAGNGRGGPAGPSRDGTGGPQGRRDE